MRKTTHRAQKTEDRIQITEKRRTNGGNHRDVLERQLRIWQKANGA